MDGERNFWQTDTKSFSRKIKFLYVSKISTSDTISKVIKRGYDIMGNVASQ